MMPSSWSFFKTKGDTMNIRQLDVEQPVAKPWPLEEQSQIKFANHPEWFLIKVRRKIVELKEERANLRKALREEKDETDELRTLNLRGLSDIQDLQHSVKRLKQALRVCQDELFRLLPHDHISDSEIIRQYENICQQTSSWVADAVYTSNANKAPHMELFSDGGNPGTTAILSKGPNAGEYLLTRVIHSYLMEIFLGEQVYLLGLPSQTVDALKKAEKSMASLKPCREKSIISTWRSETLKALSATSEVRQEATNLAQSATLKIIQRLTNLLPGLPDLADNLKDLFENVILPAKSLATDFQVAPSRYTFSMKEVEGGRCLRDYLSKITMIDVKTGTTLSPDRPFTRDRHGFIVDFLLQLEPSLVRTSSGTDFELELRRGVYIVELSRPVEGEEDMLGLRMTPDVITSSK